jgi:uncharacterized glyoxalase superfamily protein PhnB
MTNKEMWDAPDIVPSIIYRDVSRAVEWLERVFGFRERAEARLTWPSGGRTWIIEQRLAAKLKDDPT